MNSIPKPCKITIQYDRELSSIVGRRIEESVVSEGLPFIQFLYFFFQTYPEIEQQFPPGTLAFTLNGMRPSDHAILSDGDKISFAVGWK